MALDAEETFAITAYQGNTEIAVRLSSTLLGTKPTSPFSGPVYDYELGLPGGSEIFNRVVISPNTDIPEVFDNLEFNAIPIPPTVWLFGSGLIGLVVMARRRMQS